MVLRLKLKQIHFIYNSYFNYIYAILNVTIQFQLVMTSVMVQPFQYWIVWHLLTLLVNKSTYPLSSWPHLVKIWGIEDLGSQPIKHPYFQISKPCKFWLLADQASMHTSSKVTLSLQTEAHILSLENEPLKKPLKHQGQIWRGITPFY